MTSIRSTFHHGARLGAAAAAVSLAGVAGLAQAQATFKIGVVSTLSGPAADSFGVPGSNTAKLLVEQFNNGTAPAPYNKKGFGGMPVEVVLVDEAGGGAKQVQELRNLYQRANVDVVVGYVSSGNCLAVAPVAEELKKLLVLAECGTPRIFEDANYKYVFRTASHAAMDHAALVRYLKSRNVKVETMNLINQDYAWGHDARADFVAGMAHTFPRAKVNADLLAKPGAGQFGTEISALAGKPSDILYSSMWGGDLQAFVLQGSARGLFKNTTLVLAAAEHVLPNLLDKLPDGTIFGARGAYGPLAPKSALNDWFVSNYQSAYKMIPTQGGYRIAQAFMGLKMAVENAMAKTGGAKPTPEQIGEALRNASFDTPAGRIQMALADGHQAIQPTAFGRSKYDAANKRVTAVDVQFFAAECVNPPAGTKSLDWFNAGFPGAKCE